MTTKSNPTLPVPKGMGRFGRAAGADPVIDRTGGRFGAGIIRGVSLAARGEALGHGMWLDEVTLSQIAELASRTGEAGLKCRFTHPGMSSDGMGRHLGRLHDVRHEGDKVLGDLHFSKSAHETPDGDLAEYVMTLTEEDPAAAGLSIVFHHDWQAEEAFEEEHTVDEEYENHRGRKGIRKVFRSPDLDNENHYPHVRIRELRAADVVDEPAANPSGMFDAAPLPREVDSLMMYATGLSDQRPEVSAFGVDADRASQFFRRWAERHGVTFSIGTEAAPDPAGEQMSTETPAKPELTREQFAAELKSYTDRFGAENGAKWFSEGKSYTEALEAHCDSLQAQLAAANEATAAAEQKLASLSLGEETAVETGATDAKKRTFAQHVKAGGQKNA